MGSTVRISLKTEDVEILDSRLTGIMSRSVYCMNVVLKHLRADNTPEGLKHHAPSPLSAAGEGQQHMAGETIDPLEARVTALEDKVQRHDKILKRFSE